MGLHRGKTLAKLPFLVGSRFIEFSPERKPSVFREGEQESNPSSIGTLIIQEAASSIKAGATQTYKSETVETELIKSFNIIGEHCECCHRRMKKKDINIHTVTLPSGAIIEVCCKVAEQYNQKINYDRR